METITWPDHRAKSFKHFHEFYCNQALCDVSLIAQNGTTFKAHQLLLAINSSFFHWVFHGWRETNEQVTEFKTDIESHVLDALLSLIYQGEVKIPSAWPWRQKILEAANTLQFTGILEALQVSGERGASQIDQRNRGTTFQIGSRDVEAGFQTEPQDQGTGPVIEARDRGAGFDMQPRDGSLGFPDESGNRDRGIQIAPRHTGTSLQIDPKDNRTGLQTGHLAFVAQTARSAAEGHIAVSQINRRSVEFLGAQNNHQTTSNIATSIGLYDGGHTNLQTVSVHSSGTNVMHFEPPVSILSSSTGIHTSQAINTVQDFHSSHVLHSDTQSVFTNSVNCDGSENRWATDSQKNLAPKGFVNPNASTQNQASNILFNHLPPTHNPQTSPPDESHDHQIPVRLQTSVSSNSFIGKEVEGTSHIRGQKMIPSDHNPVGSQATGDTNVGSSNAYSSTDIKLDKYEPNKNATNVKSLLVSADVLEGPGSNLAMEDNNRSHLGSRETSCVESSKQSLRSKMLDVTPSISGLDEKSWIVPSKGGSFEEKVSQISEKKNLNLQGLKSKVYQSKGKGKQNNKNKSYDNLSLDTDSSSGRQTRSKSLPKPEANSQIQRVKRNLMASKLKVRDTFDHNYKVNPVDTRKVKTRKPASRDSVPSTKKTKGVKVKSKARKGTHIKKNTTQNSKAQNTRITSVKYLKGGQKAHLILPQRGGCKRKLHMKRLLKTLCQRHRLNLWLKSLYMASRLHPSSDQHYKCWLCSKGFKRYSCWRLHSMATHLQSKKPVQSSHGFHVKKTKGQRMKMSPGQCLKCTECGSKYSLRKTLKFHLMQVHHMTLEQVEMNAELLVKCELKGCHFASIDFGELERHAKAEHPTVKYKCRHCQRPRMFHLLTMLDKHITKVHGDKPQFTCTDCGQQFMKHVYLQEHERDQHGIQHSVKLFRCDVEGCEYKTVRKVFLDKHRQIGHQEHKCPHCNIVVKTHDTLQTHIKTMHLNIRPFLCDICGMSFAKEPVLRLHVKTKHDQEKEYKCQYCPYGTNVHWYLANHVFHRHGVKADFDSRKELSCPHCNVKYLTNSYLQKHVRNVHDQTFKCTCDVCGKSYKSYSAMSTHRKIHQDVEQKCPYCDYSSKTGEHMKLHIRTQHMFKGMKPYGCPYCSYCSAMGGNVRKHVMHKHPGEEVKYNTNKEQILYMQIAEAEMERSNRDRGETRTKT